MVPGERREGERLAEARLVVRESFVDEETYETSHEPRSKPYVHDGLSIEIYLTILIIDISSKLWI